jgi:hypothetical protein
LGFATAASVEEGLMAAGLAGVPFSYGGKGKEKTREERRVARRDVG